MRTLYFSLGWLFFALGFIGVFLPILPTTPFMLLALWCFARSSDRFHNWLYHHKLFGPPLQQWEQYRVIPPYAKAISVTFMSASLVLVYGFYDVHWALSIAMTLVIAYGLWFVLTKPSYPPEA